MELATASFSTALTHPMLRQQYGPEGEHFQYGDQRWPRIDDEGTCWIPEDFKVSEMDDDVKYIDYEDSLSQVMRAECEQQPWMAVCETPLYWEEVDCDIYAVKSSGGGAVDEAAEEAKGRGGAPLWIVLPVQLADWPELDSKNQVLGFVPLLTVALLAGFAAHSPSALLPPLALPAHIQACPLLRLCLGVFC